MEDRDSVGCVRVRIAFRRLGKEGLASCTILALVSLVFPCCNSNLPSIIRTASLCYSSEPHLTPDCSCVVGEQYQDDGLITKGWPESPGLGDRLTPALRNRHRHGVCATVLLPYWLGKPPLCHSVAHRHLPPEPISNLSHIYSLLRRAKA